MMHARPSRARWTKALIATIPVGITIVIAACSDNTPAIPQAALRATIGPGPSGSGADAANCGLNTEKIAPVGNPSSDAKQAISVANGSGGVVVECTIVPSNKAGVFNVSGKVQLENGDDKGNLTISGTFLPPTGVSSQQANAGPITATFVRGDISGSFKETDCTAWYSEDPTTPMTGTCPTDASGKCVMGVASGRLWTTIFCPAAKYVGTATNHTACQGIAEIKFENCATGS